MSQSAELQIRSYQPGDEDEIYALFARSYGKEIQDGLWTWRFRENASGPGQIQLAWSDDHLAGHYAVSSVRLRVAGTNVLTALSGTTMTDPEFRGQGLFPMLADATYEMMRQNEMPFVWGFPNSQSHGGFVKNLAWLDTYEVPFLRLKLGNARRPLPTGEGIVSLERADDRFDRLWDQNADLTPVAAVRDCRQVNWRFMDHPTEEYSLVALLSGEELCGYAVYKQYGDELQIIDLFVGEADDGGLRLVAAVAAEAQSRGLGAIAMWLPVHAPLHRQLERHGFQPAGPITYLSGRSLWNWDHSEVVGNYRNWYLTCADSDVF